MATEYSQEGFSETQHALLFAFIVKAVIQRVGEPAGEAIIRKAICQCGEEGRRRMALRAQANGHVLSMGNYLAYSEYRVRSKVMTRIEKRCFATLYRKAPLFVSILITRRIRLYSNRVTA